MKKIILLEDEKTLEQIYERNLKKAGFMVHWPRDPDGMEASAQKIKPHVVLLVHGIKGKLITKRKGKKRNPIQDDLSKITCNL
ncbi:hypothetical protein KKA33_02115 [Patescibacteria group bacterium]|nr:hypothetical protein [Patescibacteria group bacterium]